MRGARTKVDTNLAQAKQAALEEKEKEKEREGAAGKVSKPEEKLKREPSPPLEEAPAMQSDSIQRKLRELNE